MSIQVVILAAGEGKRMFSDLPKVLHKLAGKPLLARVMDTVSDIAKDNPPIIIYGHLGNIIQAALNDRAIMWVKQAEQKGTGHAVLQAAVHFKDDQRVLILYGDVPLIAVQTLQKLIDETPPDAIGMVTAHLSNPAGYGRIKRNSMQQVMGIVEEKDASDEERAIQEINSGIYLVPASYLNKWLPALKSNNAQGEYYLTDIISLAVKENIVITTVEPLMKEEIFGVNDRLQLAHLERVKQRELADGLMKQGVTLYDPARLDVRGEVKVGRDITIDVNVIFEGAINLGNGCIIGPNVILRDVVLGDGVEIKANSIVEEAYIADNSVIGPFARIRPGTVLSEEVHIGNFVEIKNSKIDAKSKVNHLSYIGDADIGKRVNVGAGTITCNYDGAHKHRTTIKDDVFIGSDTQLVAPVTINEGATIAAGATVAKDAEANKLTLTHELKQRTVDGWMRPKK